MSIKLSLEIAKELRPNDFEQFIKQTEKEAIVKFRNKTKELQEEEKQLKEQMKREWKAAGGIV